MKHRPELDGVRGVAVLAVVLMHTWLARFPGGKVGVDLFFVLSGFLITRLLLAERARDGRISLRGFYRRRAARLGPALLLAVVVALPVAVLAVPTLAENTLRGALAAVTETSNLLRLRGVDLGAFNHTWSLGVEEQFYLLWPPIVVALGTRRQVHRMAWLLASAFAVMTAVLAFTGHAAASYYGSHGPMELLLGAALGSTGRSLAPPRWLLAASAGFLAWFVVASPQWRAYPLLVAAACTVVIAGAVWRDARPFAWPPLVRVGQVSYAVYLYHFPVAFLLGLWLAGPLLAAVVLAVTLPLSFASMRYVEAPLRDRLRRSLVPHHLEVVPTGHRVAL